MLKVKNSIRGLTSVDIDELVEFQGNLKSLSDTNYLKLRNEIIQEGFSFAFHVWIDQGKTYVLDGHQRLRVLRKMRADGFEVPKLPAIAVDADDYKHAKKKVLAGASQFGTMEQQGLYEFIAEGALDWREVVEEANFPEINFPDFVASHYAELVPEDKPEKPKSEKKKKRHECPECGCQFSDD